jgi:hypothetical protein
MSVILDKKAFEKASPILATDAKRLPKLLESLAPFERRWAIAQGFDGAAHSMCVLPDAKGNIAREVHAAIGQQAAGEVEVGRGVVDPRLFPLLRHAVERGIAAPVELRAGRTGEFLHHDAAIERLGDAVAAGADLLAALVRQLPVTDPEVELLRLRRVAAVLRGLLLRERGRGGDEKAWKEVAHGRSVNPHQRLGRYGS